MSRRLNFILNKCKRLSRQLRRSSSHGSSSRSKSSREELWGDMTADNERLETVFVGTTRKQYSVSSGQLKHPLLTALIDHGMSRQDPNGGILVKCEVVVFDHLLWMLDNAEPKLTADSFEELANLYAL